MSYQLTPQAMTQVTILTNEFIDKYMAAANGEYVKVYLYLLRHQNDLVELGAIAEALNHTEADVRRALAYWERMGILSKEEGSFAADAPPLYPDSCLENTREIQIAEEKSLYGTGKPLSRPETPSKATGAEGYPLDNLNRLNGDEAFAELLYIAQKYMNKVFTQRECQTFAYLYDGLHMGKELLEYLVEYCAQLGHTSIRYIETVAINWHERGIRTVDEAKLSASAYTKEAFAVMKAFGLTDRRPGESERQIIEKWFRTWGFSRELVTEACSRTLQSAHTPSFQYADKILAAWKEEKVHTLEDVKTLDAKRRGTSSRQGEERKEAGQPRQRNTGGTGPQPQARRTPNQFHNFKQRDVDYDALILEQLQKK